jgi:hypothetical protein
MLGAWQPCFSICLSVYVWMCPSQVPEWLDGFYSYPNFKSFICYRSVPGECELSSSKLGPFRRAPEYKCIGGVFREVSVRSLGAQTRNVQFFETSSAGRTDCAVVWYSVIKNGLPSNNRVCYQGKVVKGNRL